MTEMKIYSIYFKAILRKYESRSQNRS
jgi:hypothetical protein